MFQYKDQTGEKIADINLKAYKKFSNTQLWAAISYRRSLDGAEFLTNSGAVSSQKLQQITPIIGVSFDKFMFAYNYTYQSNSLVFTNGGFHQFTLGYNFSCRREAYDCKCPAVN